MKLVEFLVAGVKGAANGSATFVLRGTASSAASVLYNDFEGTSQPGTNIITLDANGAAEVYCNAYCDVTLKTSAGATLRTVTVGDSATTVEVISDSFTGTAYSGSPSGASQPVTLAAILDKWNDSAGTLDWKVLISGVSTNLSTAFAAFSGLFVNVKANGALGDGVTDDTNAISGAISTSAGKIVFFPPGTYVFSNITISTSKFHLMGSGSSNTVLSSNGSGSIPIQVTDTTASTRKIIEGLTLNSSVSTSNRLIQFSQGQDVLISDCHIDGTNCSNNVSAIAVSSGTGQMMIRNTRWSVGNSTVGLNNLCSDQTQMTKISGCTFVIPAGFTGTVIKGADFQITNCEFDGSANTSSSICVHPTSVDTAGKFFGAVSGCTFRTGATSGFVFNLSSAVTGSKFSEAGNTFIGYDISSVTTSSTRLYTFSSSSIGDLQLSLKSRESRAIKVSTTTTASMNIAVAQDYGIITVNATDSTGAVVTINSTLPPGATTQLIVINNSGSTKTITFQTNQVTWTALADAGVASTIAVAVMSNSGLRIDCMKGHGAD